jgi:prepilin-type processing-associated H-X9-DG protein
MSTPPPNGPAYGAPPPGYGAPPPRPKNNTATVVGIVLAVVLGGGLLLTAILAAILFPVFARARENARLASCESNVKQIELGLIQYTQDNNEKFPAGDFQSAVARYAVSDAVFHCPADEAGGVDYSLNTNLQGVSLEKLNHPEAVVAVYEGKGQKLDFRHGGKAVVGFADGHVRAVTQAQAQALRWKP